MQNKSDLEKEIKYLDINSIIPFSRNNRIHGQKQIDLIANSINEFGFNQPIVVDEKNIILVGHGRLEAAKKLKLKQVPTLIKKHLTESQKKAYRILDNKLQNDSTWDFDNLKLELDALQDLDFDLNAWGLDVLRVPEFKPILQNDQNRLDEPSPKLVECPSCAHIFDARGKDAKN